MAVRIILEKENFKFSCSHFTILGPDSAERLHGHNYYLRVELVVENLNPSLGMAFDFNVVKKLVREIVAGFDEFVLLPRNSPYLKISQDAESISVEMAKKRYVFPLEDTRLLPIVNVSSEELARIIAEEIKLKLMTVIDASAGAKSLVVNVEETRGQSIAYDLNL